MAKILVGRTLSHTTDSVTTRELNQLVPVSYDYMELTYAASPNEDDLVQVVYKTGGASGTTVATITIAYNSDRNISSITRT